MNVNRFASTAKLTRLIVALVFAGLATDPSAAQIQNRVCDTIPYDYIHNRIVIPVVLNGIPVRYIVDTGGQTGTVAEVAVKAGAEAQGYAGVSDLNSNKSVFQKGVISNVALSPHHTLAQLSSLILPENGFFDELGVVGILGCDAFAGTVVTIDERNKILVINIPYRPERLKVGDGLPLLSTNSLHPIVEVPFGNTTVEVLFDTGVPDFLLLSMQDAERLTTAQAAHKESEAFGIVGAGIHGLGDPVKIARLTVPELTVGTRRFTGASGTTTVMDNSIIGAPLLHHGKVVIDFLRRRFYFLPYSQEPVDMTGEPGHWNVDILPLDGAFRITTVWESLGREAAFGDKVVEINGTRLDSVPMDEWSIRRIMADIPTDTATLIIEKEGKERRIIITKEK